MNYAIYVSLIFTDGFSVVVKSPFRMMWKNHMVLICSYFLIQVKDIEGETVALIVKKSYHNPEELIGIENKLHVECE